MPRCRCLRLFARGVPSSQPVRTCVHRRMSIVCAATCTARAPRSSLPGEWRHRHKDGKARRCRGLPSRHRVRWPGSPAGTARSTSPRSQAVWSARAQRIFETSEDLSLLQRAPAMARLVQVSPSCDAFAGLSGLTKWSDAAAKEFLARGGPRTDARARCAWRAVARPGGASGARYCHKDGHIVSIAWLSVWSKSVPTDTNFIGRDMTEYDNTAEERFARRSKWRRSASSPAAWRTTSTTS